MIINQIIFGLLAIVLGTVALKYNYQVVGMTGNVEWFEKFLGGGGTYLGFKLLSLMLILGGFLYMTGLGSPVLEFLLSPLAQFFPKSK